MTSSPTQSLRRRSDDDDLREVHRQLVDSYGGLVRKVARRVMRRLPRDQHDFEEADLVGTGVLGLFEAASRFDPDVGYAFETFAEFRIKGAMLDELRRRDFFPRRLRLKSNAISKAASKLHRELGRDPSDEELATSLGLSPSELRERRDEVTPYHWVDISDAGLSLEAPTMSAFEATAWREMRAQLVQAILQLPERERLVIDLYFSRELTLREIGAILGLTVGRISQIKQAATQRLREMVSH